MAKTLRIVVATFGIVAAIGLVALPSLAQETGGSFGGGDFGGSDSSGSSGSSGGSDYGGGGGSDYGGSSSYGGSNYGSSSYGSGGSEDAGATVAGFLCLILVGVILVVIAMAFVSVFGKRSGTSGGGGAAMPGRGDMDVSAIRIAVDHHARAILQQKLEALAKGGASATKAGRAQALHEVCVELRRNETAWLYASVDNSPMVGTREAEAAFRRIASDARSRFRIETVRAEEDNVRTQADTVARDRGEGPGLVVVTIVVAARGHLIDIHQPEDARALHTLLQAFGALGAQDLVALEIIWSPSAEDDRMTLEELARLYPEVRKIRDDTVQSRVFCGYCSSPFWAGLSRCPHCGAPTTDARAAQVPPNTPNAPST